MWTEIACSGKSRFSWLWSVHKNELLSSVQWWDIYSVKVIELNTDYSYCRKLTVTITVTEKRINNLNHTVLSMFRTSRLTANWRLFVKLSRVRSVGLTVLRCIPTLSRWSRDYSEPAYRNQPIVIIFSHHAYFHPKNIAISLCIMWISDQILPYNYIHCTIYDISLVCGMSNN